jgi:hypothetical protein
MRWNGPYSQFGYGGEENYPCLCWESNFNHPIITVNELEKIYSE